MAENSDDDPYYDDFYDRTEPVEWRTVVVNERADKSQRSDPDPTNHASLVKVATVDPDGRIVRWFEHNKDEPRDRTIKIRLTRREAGMMAELAEVLGCSIVYLIRDALAKTYSEIAEIMTTAPVEQVPRRMGVNLDEVRRPVHLQTSYVDGRVTLNLIEESPSLPPPCVCPHCLYHEAIRAAYDPSITPRKYVIHQHTGETRIMRADEPIPYGWEPGVRIPTGKALITKDLDKLRREIKKGLRAGLAYRRKWAEYAERIGTTKRPKMKKSKTRKKMMLSSAACFLKVFGASCRVRIPTGGLPPDMTQWIMERREDISMMSKADARLLGRHYAHMVQGYPPRNHYRVRRKSDVVDSSKT